MGAPSPAKHDGSRLRMEACRCLGVVLSLLIALSCTLYTLFRQLPVMKPEETLILRKFPTTDIPTLLQQREVLLGYAQTNPVVMGMLVFLVYVMMQTFAIPGTLTLSIMSGALYGTFGGLIFVSVVCTAGATSCYLLSGMVGSGLASYVWPGKLEEFASQVEKHRSDIFSYIIFLRVTPILPNTFINVVSPLVRLPILPFVTGTFFGCMPNNLIAVNAGNRLTELTSFADLYDFRSLLLGLGIGVAALASIVWRSRARKQHAQ